MVTFTSLLNAVVAPAAVTKAVTGEVLLILTRVETKPWAPSKLKKVAN